MSCENIGSTWGSMWSFLWGDGIPSAREYLQSLLPPGFAWSRNRCAQITMLLDGLGFELERVATRGEDLIDETDPRLAEELLSQWESVLQLPGDCDTNPPTTLAGRRADAHAKLLARGRQDPLFYIQVADALGYTVTISRYDQFNCQSKCNAGLYAGQWQHAVLVSGSSGSYDETLECRLDDMRQTHGAVVLELA